MKKLLSILICFAMVISLSPTMLVGAAGGNTYYIKPDNGDNVDDSGTGSAADDALERTLYDVAQELRAGDTAIFTDGTYYETVPTEFAYSGEAGNSITIKAQNRHKAVIVYSEDCSDTQKLNVNKSYINVRDFAITQEKVSDNSNLDILLNCGVGKGSEIEGCEITGNMFGPAFEEGIKVKYARNILAADNIIDSPTHDGIDVFGCDGVEVFGNKIINCGSTGILVKGNSKNCLIYNNYVYNDEKESSQAYSIGGQSDSSSPYVTAENEGYEIYNSVFYNNIAYCKDRLITTGFVFSGAYKCHAYNNIVYGARDGFALTSAADKQNGWAWDPKTVDPVLYNNVVMNVTNVYNVWSGDAAPVNMISDYNAFYNWGSSAYTPTEEHSLRGVDPKFRNVENGDFSLAEDSPLIDAGNSIPSVVDTVTINLVDYNEEERKTPWDIGIYNADKGQNTPLLDEDFTGGAIGEALTHISNANLTSWGDLYANYGGSTTTIKFAADPENASNPVVLFERTSQLGAWQYLGRRFGSSTTADGTIKDGIQNVKFRMRKAGETSRTFQFNIWDTGASSPISFDFKDDKVKMLAVSGSQSEGSVTIHDDAWNDVEVEIDQRDSGSEPLRISVYVNGVLAIKDSKMARIGGAANNGCIGEMAWRIDDAATATEGVDNDGFYARFMLDDIYVTEVSNTTVKEVKLSDDMSSAEIVFNNNMDTATLNNIMLDGSSDNIAGISAVNARKCIVSFETPLSPGFIEYSFSFDGVKDIYARELDGVKRVVTTRAAQLDVNAIKFYSTYNPEGTKTVVNNLSGCDGTSSITAAFSARNESLRNISAVLIAVHKGADGKVKAVKAIDASILAQKSDSKYIAVGEVSPTDTIEAYLWDSVKGMTPIANGISINATDDDEIPLNENKVLNSIDINADISNVPSTDNMKMTVSGTASQAGGAVTAYVLKPDKKLDDLTVDNFSSFVDFAAQMPAGSGGSYSFNYIITATSEQEGKTYTAYVGGNNIAQPLSDSVIFYSAEFERLVRERVANATADEIVQMLTGTLCVPTADSGVRLSDFLDLDMTSYNALCDCTEYENFKKRVSIALSEPTAYANKEEIVNVFKDSVELETQNQAAYITLLGQVNAAAWSELEALLGNVSNLPLTGSYNSIKNNSDLLETFYKKLANEYTFANFKELREAFENEAKTLIPPPGNGGTDYGDGGGGGGGGGGRKDVEYESSMNTAGTATPIVNEDTASKTDFDDIDTVPWAQEAIKALAKQEIIAGTGNNKFAPNLNVTREQFVKMVVLAFDLYDDDAQARQFMDVGVNTWYEKYVASAVASGIIYGMDEEHFGVGKELSRAEMATILDRVCSYKGITFANKTDDVTYSDAADIPPYAYESIIKMSGAGIMNGVGNNMFAPMEKTTRAMAARVIWLLRGEK